MVVKYRLKLIIIFYQPKVLYTKSSLSRFFVIALVLLYLKSDVVQRLSLISFRHGTTY